MLKYGKVYPLLRISLFIPVYTFQLSKRIHEPRGETGATKMLVNRCTWIRLEVSKQKMYVVVINLDPLNGQVRLDAH